MLGEKKFKSEPAAESVTVKCDSAEGVLVSGRKILVADTPGVYDTKEVHMVDEVINFFECLAPGPHALLIILSPDRISKRDVNILEEVQNLFEDEFFFTYTILVFTRKSEIIGEFGCSTDIHEYIKDHTNDVIKNLYEKCGKRAVAVENKQSWEKRKIDANEVFTEIDKLDGVYHHWYFRKVQEAEALKRELRKKCILM